MSELSRRQFFKLSMAAAAAASIPDAVQQVMTASDNGGWLPCDGQIVDRFTYPELFAALGTAYGGDGVNDFNIPDTRGGFIVAGGFSSYAKAPKVMFYDFIKVRRSDDDYPIGSVVRLSKPVGATA